MQDWIKPIGNHLFHCSAKCDGDPEKLIQMWQSLMEHITGKHSFARKFPRYKKCTNMKYTRAQNIKKKWIPKLTPAYEAINSVVNKKAYLTDMVHLTNAHHTGNLEVFRSLVNSYAPKRKELELNVQDARVKLAILDHNTNVGKQQAVMER